MSGVPPIIGRLAERLYGGPLVRNVLRGELVEQLVLEALGEDWRAAADYEAWDIESTDGAVRIQVKNSAARQSWSADGDRPSRPSFSIKASRAWTLAAGRAAAAERHANLYVFGWHPGMDDGADHRIGAQWEFYVVPTAKLPSSDSIGMTKLRTLSPAFGIEELATAIRAVP